MAQNRQVLSPKQPHQQGQDGADQQAGDQGKMKAEITLGIIDVARQPPQPAFAKTRPEQDTNTDDQQTGDDEKFSQVLHTVGLGGFGRFEKVDHGFAKGSQIARRAAGNQVAVDDDWLIHPNTTGIFEIVLDP